MNSSNQETLSFEFKQLQILYRTALKQATPFYLEQLQKRNADILVLSRRVITQHLADCPKHIASLQAEMAQVASRADVVASGKTTIKVNCPVPLAGRVTVHGQGNQLDWERGTPLRRLDDGAVGFESTGALEYKLKFNGKWEEMEGNRKIAAGQTEVITPAVTLPIAPVKLTSRQVSQNDNLYLRGEGTIKFNGIIQNLSWNKGIAMQRVGNEFFLMLDEPADIVNFKVLINDDSNRWSEGANLSLKKGETLTREVVFPGPTVEVPRTGAGRVAYNDRNDAEPVAQLEARVTDDTIAFDF